MDMHLIHHVHGKRLPEKLQDYIKKRFILTPEYVKLLRCFEYAGTVDDRQVRRFRVFDRKKAESMRLVIHDIGDLEKYPETIVFEGYIDQSGNAYAADRRSPKKKNK